MQPRIFLVRFDRGLLKAANVSGRFVAGAQYGPNAAQGLPFEGSAPKNNCAKLKAQVLCVQSQWRGLAGQSTVTVWNKPFRAMRSLKGRRLRLVFRFNSEQSVGLGTLGGILFLQLQGKASTSR